MKKCPKCGAELGENARFCLFCMTSFEDKQVITAPKLSSKRWLLIIAAALTIVTIVLCILFFIPEGKAPNGGESKSGIAGNGKDSFIEEKGDGSINNETQNSDSASEESPGDFEGNQNNRDNQLQSEKGSINGGYNTSTPNSNGGNTTVNSTASKNPSKSQNPTTGGGASSNTSVTSTKSSSTTTTSKVVTSTTTSTAPSFSYVTATLENTYPPGESIYAPEDAIVITKVNYRAENGNYVIPERIDGKKVAAIMPSAFSDSSISSSVKSVTLPSTVRTVWSNAFKNCNNLTALYLKSAVIEIYKDALPSVSNRNGTLTIYCKKDCRNFNFYYYRNIAGQYSATYKEWNG